MSFQLIFVIETTRNSNTDWIYISDTIKRFYSFDRTSFKLSKVYMDGKYKYEYKRKEIDKLIKDYKRHAHGDSKVIYCFDCDNYDSNADDANFLAKAKKYCQENDYEFVWFCKDIENVYIGKRIDKKQKEETANRFRTNNWITSLEAKKLRSNDKYEIGHSNILYVLDKYLEKKIDKKC